MSACVSTKDDVIEFFQREPDKYLWDVNEYTPETLPTGPYIMRYGSHASNDMLDAVVNNANGNHLCVEIRIYSERYRCVNGIKMGITSNAVFEILGDPAEIIENASRDTASWDPNIFFKDLDGIEGLHYYMDTESGIRISFSNDRIDCFFICDDITAFEVLK